MNSNLDELLRSLNPLLHEEEWVFCTLPAGVAPPDDAVAVFRESESVTVIVTRERAHAIGLKPLYVAAWITLTAYSDLDAVGFLAAISAKMAAAGISCNVISAVHHDHLFVPYEKRQRALEALKQLQLSPSGSPRIQ
jgi:uncharacterized protein